MKIVKWKKEKKYHTVETAPQSNSKVIEREKPESYTYVLLYTGPILLLTRIYWVIHILILIINAYRYEVIKSKTKNTTLSEQFQNLVEKQKNTTLSEQFQNLVEKQKNTTL